MKFTDRLNSTIRTTSHEKNNLHPLKLKSAEYILYALFIVILLAIVYAKFINPSFNIYEFISVNILIAAIGIVALVIYSLQLSVKLLERDLRVMHKLSLKLKDDLLKSGQMIEEKNAQVTHYQKRIRKFLHYYQTFIKNSHSIIGIHDLNGRFNYISPTINSILGYSKTDLAGKSPFSICHEDDIQNLEQAFSFNKSHINQTRVRLQSVNGNYKWFEVITKLERISNGRQSIFSYSSEILKSDESDLNLEFVGQQNISSEI